MDEVEGWCWRGEKAPGKDQRCDGGGGGGGIQEAAAVEHGDSLGWPRRETVLGAVGFVITRGVGVSLYGHTMRPGIEGIPRDGDKAFRLLAMASVQVLEQFRRLISPMQIHIAQADDECESW